MSEGDDNLVLRRLEEMRDSLKASGSIERELDDIEVQLRSIHADIGELRSDESNDKEPPNPD